MIWLLTIFLLLPLPALANISYVQMGTGGTGSGTVSATMPASGVVAGDLFLMCIGHKPSGITPTTPATQGGWTAISNNMAVGGSGSGTNDQGSTQSTVFYRIATANGESGAVSSTITGGGSAYANIIQYHNSTGLWSIAAGQGGDSTLDTSYSATMNVDPDITTDDMVIACHGKSVGSTNGASGITEAMTTSGVVYDTVTERWENGTTLGDNVGIILSEFPVISGSSGGNLSTASYTYVTLPVVGGTVAVRLRQSGGTPPGPGCTTTLNSLAQATVQAAINAADTGATICFASSTDDVGVTWTTTVALTPSVTINKGITLQGNTTCTGNGTVATPVTCTDHTIILDGTATTAGSDILLMTGTNARVTGISFKDPRQVSDSGLMVKMRCSSCRTDHNSFTHTNAVLAPHAILSVSYNGVDILGSQLIDHNYIKNMNNGVVVYGQTAAEVSNSALIGTQSWEHPLTMGDSLATYIEDNYFDFDQTYNGAYDSYYGARAVFRSNLVKNTNMGGHGYDSAARSTLRQEVYRNTITNPTNTSQTTVPTWWETRGGVHMVWQNTITTAGGSYAKHLTLVYYRSEPKGCPTCGETTSTPAFKGICGEDMSGDSAQGDATYLKTHPTSIETAGHWYNGGADGSLNWKDGNTVGQHGYPCRDQVGRGPSTDPANDWPTKFTLAANPVYAQAFMPGYSFGNSFKGAAPTIANISITASCVIIGCVNDDTRLSTYHYVNNRDFYVEVASFDGTVGTGTGVVASRPATCTVGVGYLATDQGSWNTSSDGLGSGLFYTCTSINTWTVTYTPYSYPHPLQTTFVPPLPAAPTGLRTIGAISSTGCTFIWNASSLSGLLGYHVYHGTSPGVYSTPINHTAATAAAAHAPFRQYTFQLAQAGTHYFSVTAYNADGDTAYATEITCTSTGLSRTAASTRSAR